VKATYPVADIFHSLQGEGHFVGYPMTFVRLAGCSVKDCHIRTECDEAPWKMRERLTVEEILGTIETVSGRIDFEPHGIVCITGGEPTDHDLMPLCTALYTAGKRIHMETSGVRPVVGFPLEWLTVSPKVRGGLVQKTGHALKVVVRHEWGDGEDAWKRVEEYDRGTQFFHRYLQPLTLNDGPVNLPEVTRMLLSGRNADGRWALSTQAHRVWKLA
jgi:7-carboxy-7-deazaguanine synthase